MEDKSIVKVSKERWLKAQSFENQTWQVNNQTNGYLKVAYKFFKALKSPKKFFQMLYYKDFYCGDDWNYWWLEKFEHYKVLPKFLNKALEVGSGPYSNIRLVSQIIGIQEIVCLDPLMEEYKKFKRTWVSEQSKKNKILALAGKGESLNLLPESFDLVICNNVLDHVEDAQACLLEITRVLKKGGYFVFGQDLTNEQDMELQNVREEVGHPIKLYDATLNQFISPRYKSLLKKVLPRQEGRNPSSHSGTYIFIGTKI